MFEVFMSYKLCRTSYSQKYFFSLSHYFLVILFHQSNIKKAEKCFCTFPGDGGFVDLREEHILR